MVYDRVGDGDKFSYKSVGLGKPNFYGTALVQYKSKLNSFFVNRNAAI